MTTFLSRFLLCFFVFFFIVHHVSICQTRQEIVVGLQGNPEQQTAMIGPALSSPDPALHESAIILWSELPLHLKKKLIPNICNFYPNATDIELRFLALRQFSNPELLTSDTTTLFVHILESNKEQEQIEALWILSALNRQARFAVPTLLTIYGHSTASVQELILRVFISTRPEYSDQLGKILLTALDADNTNLSWQAASLLSIIGPKNDSAIINSLQKKLNISDMTVLTYVIDTLGILTNANDSRSIELLWNLRQNEDAYVRIAVFRAILQITNGKHSEANRSLQKELFHPQPLVRLAAATVVLSYDPQSGKAISILVQSGQNFPKESIAAMGNVGLGHPAILAYLDQQYRQNPKQRLAILATFWVIHSKSRLPSLVYFRELLASEKDSEVREYLQQILQYSPYK